MAIEVVATLEQMAHIYRLSPDGGAKSERFAAYRMACEQRAPLHGFNPMTSKPVLATIEWLLEIEAEQRLRTVANQVALDLGYGGAAKMHITIATPGVWTDRLAAQVEHQLLAKDPGGVLWWFDDPLDPAVLDLSVIAQVVRLIAQQADGPPKTLAAAVAQEGRAGAIAGRRGQLNPAAAEILDAFADDPSLSVMTAFLFGDGAATAMGFTPLGLDADVGRSHAIALAG